MNVFDDVKQARKDYKADKAKEKQYIKALEAYVKQLAKDEKGNPND